MVEELEDVSVVTRTVEGNGISSESNSEIMEGEPTEPDRKTSSDKSSERTDAATTGGEIYMHEGASGCPRFN